jgi:branched-chain amino acid transport system substrate-binding protein
MEAPGQCVGKINNCKPKNEEEKEMMKKLWVMLVIVMLVCFGMIASGYCQAKQGFDDKEIRIGAWGPQTGPAAPWGSISRAPGLLFQLVNEEGGIHGRKIKFFLRDDQYNPAQTKLAAKDLVEQQGVMAVTSGMGSSGTLAVKDYLAQHKVVAVGMCTGAKELVIPTNPYLFSSFDLFGDEMSVLTKYVVEVLKFKEIGFLYQNDPMGWDALNGARERMASYGMKFLVEIPVEPTEKDLSSQIMKFKTAGVKCLMMQVAPTPGVVAVKTAAAIGYKPQFVSADTLGAAPEMFKMTGGLWAGTITGGKCLDPQGNHPLVVKYRNAAKRLMPEQPFNAWFLSGIMFAEPIVEALKMAGPNLSTDALLKALNSIKNFQGVGPKITWTPNQHQGVNSTIIWKCGPNGEFIKLQDWTPNELTKWRSKSGI